MGENGVRTGYRLRRLVGGLAGMGAITVALLMVASPMAGAASAVSFPHSTLSISWSNYQAGCALGKIAKPGLSLTTGLGHVSMKSAAKTCPPLKGGKAVSSYADDSSGLGITQYVKVAKAATQVNVSWNISATALAAASGTLAKCPVNHYSFSYTSGNTTVTFNENYSYCSAEASWEVYVEPEVYDATTGLYSSAFMSAYNESGNYYDAYSYTYNYSNPYYKNTTYSGSYTYTYGGPYTTHLSWAPSAIMTGSFSVGDHLVIYANMYVYTYAEIQGETHGSAVASFLASSPAGHVDVTGITLS